MPMKFNKGGREVSPDNSTIGVQLNDQFWSRVAVKEAKKEIVFSQMGGKITQPQHYGDKLVKYVHIPILDDRNINDQGIDANGVKMVPGVWYAYDADGNRITAGATEDGGQGYATKADAMTAAGATGFVKAGNGNLYGSSKDIRVQNGAMPVLGEEGGRVNVVGLKRDKVEADVTEYGFSIEFTERELQMDTERGLLKRFSQEIGRAYGELREAQIRNDLISASESFRLFGGAATSIDQIDDTCTLDYSLLRKMDKAYKDIRCPYQTNILTGSNKYGTIAIGKARYAYIGAELIPTLEDLEHNGRAMWVPMEDYAYGKDHAQGEKGRIGSFRFIEVQEMPNYSGQGAAATNANFYSSTGDDGNLHYDVFPVLFVGADSFSTVHFEGDVARVKTKMPEIIPGVDNYGKKGVVSVSWYNGTLITRPERIRSIAVAAKIA
jgi:N4-gp56 family major capsid protein